MGQKEASKVTWGYLIAFVLGAWAGIFLMSILVIAGDEEIEK